MSDVREYDIDIVCHADGSWTHDGDPIEQERVLRFFKRGLGRDDQGAFIFNEYKGYGERARVTLVGFPLRVLSIDIEAEPWIGRLDDGTEEVLLPSAFACRTPDELAVSVRNGQFWALLDAEAVADLHDFVDVDPNGAYLLRVGGEDFPIFQDPTLDAGGASGN